MEDFIDFCKIYKGEKLNPYSDFENKTIWEAEKHAINFSKNLLSENLNVNQEDFILFVQNSISFLSKNIDYENFEERRRYNDLRLSYPNLST